LSTVDNTRVSHSRQWSNYNVITTSEARIKVGSVNMLVFKFTDRGLLQTARDYEV